MENKMKYKVDWVEVKKSAKGNTYYVATLVSPTGERFDDVSCFDELNLAEEYEGTIVKNGKYTNFNIEKEKKAYAPRSGGASIKQAQERKAEMIEQAQERKNESISYFNAINSAIALLKGSMPMESDADKETMKIELLKWRDWFLAQWRDFEARDYQTKHNPF